MVQRKVHIKEGIQADHIKSEKLSSSQDGKNRMKKKMKKSRSIKLSNIEALQSSSSPPSSRRCSSSSSPLLVPRTAPAGSASPQKKQQPLARATDGSPNYMKPTSSSHAKKELFNVSLRNIHQSVPNSKNSARKSYSDSKASSVSSSSKSLSLVRSLTKTTSFKASRANCQRKSTKATCSSTLKDSKFPAYLMLNPGGTESDGTSVMNVCPYTYCSLNGHHHRHAALPPLKSFVAARREFLKIQKSASPRRSKKKDSEIDQSNAKATFEENSMDILIEIYAKEREGIEIIPVTPGSEIEVVKEFGKSFDDVAIEVVDTKGKLLQEEKAEEISMGSYCGDDSYDGESMKDVEEMDDDYDSKATEMEWEEERRIYGLGDEAEDVDSSVFSEEVTVTDTDSKLESLYKSSRDSSVTWFDEIISSYHDEILAEEILRVDDSEKSQLSEEHVDDEASNEVNALDEETTNNIQCQKMTETCTNVSEAGGEDRFSIQDNDDDESGNEESRVQGKELLKGRANKNFQNKSCDANMTKKFAITCKRRGDSEDDETRKFNPKEPNFLPTVLEPEPEKVDLRHQMMDERKDAEEWMLDCALRQVVTKLAPARKKKVALLVEAFETVMPTMPKCETHHHIRRRNNSAFPHAGRIQACS